jgi:acyl-CoA thioester hydrolase
MPKVKLKKQDKYEFEYARILQVSDINYGGHLGNDSIVTIVHEARIDMLNKLGCTELNLGDNRTGIIMADLAVNYLGQGYLLDKVTVFSHIDEITSASFRIFHYIVKDKAPVALAETGIITYDYQAKSIASIPEIFLKKIEEHLKNK